ncbi:asparaginase [candidate division GN15 bacterium]|nr:asparaginase [candidate division GN15 bacterium]
MTLSNSRFDYAEATGSGVEVAAHVYRGETVESLHYAAIAVVDASGALTHYVGDPTMMTATRSSVKPFQALPLVKSGAADRYGLTPKQLAVICASHNGSDEHRDTVLSVLEAGGNDPSMLQCGTHWPLQMRLFNEYPQAGEDDDPVRHNCSGKHSGFLALTRFLGGAVESYLEKDSETQRLVREAVGRYCEYEPEKLGVAIDGCSAPVFSMPLINLARGFQKLAAGAGVDEAEQAAATRIRDAMCAHPIMVSGERRFDYDLARSMPGRVVCKVGAEAVQGIGLVDPPIGIAVKVLDGGTRARDPISVEVLRQLGIIDKIEDFPYLKGYDRPEIRNYRKLLTGHIVPTFTLKRA